MPITLYNSCIFFSTIVSITYVCKSLQNMYNSLQHIPASISIALPACIGSVAYKQTWQPFAKISFCSFTIQQNLTPTFANNVRYRAALIEHFALVFPFDFDRDLRALVGRRVILAFAYNFANNSLVLRRRDVFALLTWQRRTWFFRLFKKTRSMTEQDVVAQYSHVFGKHQQRHVMVSFRVLKIQNQFEAAFDTTWNALLHIFRHQLQMKPTGAWCKWKDKSKRSSSKTPTSQSNSSISKTRVAFFGIFGGLPCSP